MIGLLKDLCHKLDNSMTVLQIHIQIQYYLHYNNIKKLIIARYRLVCCQNLIYNEIFRFKCRLILILFLNIH